MEVIVKKFFYLLILLSVSGCSDSEGETQNIVEDNSCEGVLFDDKSRFVISEDVSCVTNIANSYQNLQPQFVQKMEPIEQFMPADADNLLESIESKQQLYRNLVLEDLGTMPSSISVQGEYLSTEELSDHFRIRVQYKVQNSGNTIIDWVHAYLLLPKDFQVRSPLPAVLTLPQSVKVGKDQTVGNIDLDDIYERSEYNPDMEQGLDLVRRGYVVLAPDSIGMGDRVYTDKDGKPQYFNYRSFLENFPNWSVTGKMLWDHQRGIDFLLSLTNSLSNSEGSILVDPEKIAVIGNSLGGNNAIFLAALDSRISLLATTSGYTRLASDGFMSRYNGYIPKVFDRWRNNQSQPWDYEDLLLFNNT
tara:strand:+ start:38311 stop:39393 length:1083 start_codon:yes stop_codon:yes gene_type:complete